MKLTSKQAHVLANLNRVVPLPGRSGLPRYQLDGVECTPQLKGLIVLKLIRKHSARMFVRVRPPQAYDNIVGERQAPLAGTIEAMKTALLRPAPVRAISQTNK